MGRFQHRNSRLYLCSSLLLTRSWKDSPCYHTFIKPSSNTISKQCLSQRFSLILARKFRVRKKSKVQARTKALPTNEATGAPHPTQALVPSTGCKEDTIEYFPQLPIELRHMIWKLLLPGPRTVVIKLAKNPKPKPPGRGKKAREYKNTIYVVISNLPMLLHICRESRQLGLKPYEPILRCRISGMPAYFDFSQDALYLIDVAIITSLLRG